MISSLPLPDWIPPWIQIAILLIVLFFAVMLLLMPFSVFGVKARLESIDARLDEIQGEIRSLSLRLPEPGAIDEADRARPLPGAALRPPIPPAPLSPGRGSTPPRGRLEPRL